MAELDPSTLLQTARRLNLLNEDQLRQCWEEVDVQSCSPQDLLKFLERKAFLTPWQGAKLLKGDTDGYFLGGYRVLYRIAAGSFGRVFRADDPRTGEVVAIKVLRRRWSEDEHKIELFEREGKVGMSLRHPNIVQILAVSKDPATQQYFIVMEFVEGGTLRDFLGIRKKLDLEEALRLLEETAAGLAYAYSRGLTHRDIKLTNILMSTQRVAKLVDFGLAEFSETGNTEDEETNVDRTVDYAGLERASGVKQGDTRSDIYFLGCVFYELLTGRPLLSVTKDRYARMQRQRFEVLAQLRRDDPDVPPLAHRLLEKMVAFEPAYRYQTPAHLYEAVRHSRLELSGETTELTAPEGQTTIFVVEKHPKLQDAIRERFKKLGYRVLMSIEPARALQRYQQQPYHALVIDVGTVGREGLEVLEQVAREANQVRLTFAGIILLNEDQAESARRFNGFTNVATLVRPITIGQLSDQLVDMVSAEV